MDSLEIEVKFLLASPEPVREALIGLGAEPGERRFELNYRYADACGRLEANRCLLRLRKDRRASLTFKSDPAGGGEFKVLRELEVEVSDFDTMNRILEALGFSRAQVYEKWRETLRLGATLCCLDTLPFGSFLEIEGSREEIRRLAGLLDFDWNRRIVKTYLDLFDLVRERMGWTVPDLTFEAFRNLRVPLAELGPLFEAGAPGASP